MWEYLLKTLTVLPKAGRLNRTCSREGLVYGLQLIKQRCKLPAELQGAEVLVKRCVKRFDLLRNQVE